MGHDDTTVGGSRTEDVRQDACDVFIGKAVKPVPPDALGSEPARQRERGGDLGLGMMESRVEAGDLRQSGVKLCEGVDGGKVMGLMERGQRNEAAQLGGHRRIDQDRRSIKRSAMHHPMSGRDQLMVKIVGFQPAQQRGQRVFMRGAFCQILIDQRRAELRSFAVK